MSFNRQISDFYKGSEYRGFKKRAKPKKEADMTDNIGKSCMGVYETDIELSARILTLFFDLRHRGAYELVYTDAFDAVYGRFKHSV